MNFVPEIGVAQIVTSETLGVRLASRHKTKFLLMKSVQFSQVEQQGIQIVFVGLVHLFENAHRRVEIGQDFVDDVSSMRDGAIRQGETDVANAFETFGNGVENLQTKANRRKRSRVERTSAVV